ncbi:hypothetical protein [Shinella sp. G-2]|uniref:hypothetical protein n=1 Tax=Shinella sp. G-2 TaxID=3133141 RepID=UPI003D08C444
MQANGNPEPATSRRSPTRRLISLLLGGLMALGGAFAFLWMFFHVVEPVKGLFWIAPVVVSVIGVAIIWDDIRNP